MESQLAELKIENESLKRRLAAIEQALLNLTGFYLVTEDSSEQGLLKFGTAPAQVNPEPVA